MATKDATRTTIRPTGDRVFVRRENMEEETPGGIVLPDQAQEKKAFGHIVAVGPGRLLASGERADMTLKVDDYVCFAPFAETITIDDEELIALREDDIYAALDRE